MIKEFYMGLDFDFPDNIAIEHEVEAIIRDHWLNFDYKINDDRSIDVIGDVVFPDFASFLTVLPLRFNNVSGNFDCSRLVNLKSLTGSPVHVHGIFNCAFTKITSLEYAPESAETLIFDNNLESLSTGNRNCKFNHVHILIINSNPVNGLSDQIVNNSEYLPVILKYQNYFEVWKDGLFNLEGFHVLILEIKEGLE